MQAEGVIGQYAIGGAVGAAFYLEPAATIDLDVFVILPGKSTGALVSLAPIYEHLKARGGRAQDEYIVICDGRFSFWFPAMTLNWRQCAMRSPQQSMLSLRESCPQST